MSSHLFSPIKLGPLSLPNRIAVAPMCQYSAQDGTPGDCPDPPMIDRTLDEARSAPCRDVAQEACFIARAALQNAFRHAHAAQVTLEAAFGDETFGLRERAAAIGGHLDIVPAQAGQP